MSLGILIKDPGKPQNHRDSRQNEVDVVASHVLVAQNLEAKVLFFCLSLWLRAEQPKLKAKKIYQLGYAFTMVILHSFLIKKGKFFQNSFHQNVEEVEENADSADDDGERTMYRIVRILMVMIIMILMMRMIDDYDYEDDCEDDDDIDVDDESDEDDVKSLS